MSHTLLILKIYTTFKDVQMMLKIFFDISTGFRFSKISVECSVHLCSCPCIVLLPSLMYILSLLVIYLPLFWLFCTKNGQKLTFWTYNQGQLQRWTEHSTLIFENLKPVEISKNIFNIICTSLKVVWDINYTLAIKLIIPISSYQCTLSNSVL